MYSYCLLHQIQYAQNPNFGGILFLDHKTFLDRIQHVFNTGPCPRTPPLPSSFFNIFYYSHFPASYPVPSPFWLYCMPLYVHLSCGTPRCHCQSQLYRHSQKIGFADARPIINSSMTLGWSLVKNRNALSLTPMDRAVVLYS